MPQKKRMCGSLVRFIYLSISVMSREQFLKVVAKCGNKGRYFKLKTKWLDYKARSAENSVDKSHQNLGQSNPGNDIKWA